MRFFANAAAVNYYYRQFNGGIERKGSILFRKNAAYSKFKSEQKSGIKQRI